MPGVFHECFLSLAPDSKRKCFFIICVLSMFVVNCGAQSDTKDYLKKCRLYHVIFAQELRTKRPFKIWDSWRNVRKGLVVSNFEELIVRGKKHVDLDELIIKLEH